MNWAGTVFEEYEDEYALLYFASDRGAFDALMNNKGVPIEERAKLWGRLTKMQRDFEQKNENKDEFQYYGVVSGYFDFDLTFLDFPEVVDDSVKFLGGVSLSDALDSYNGPTNSILDLSKNYLRDIQPLLGFIEANEFVRVVDLSYNRLCTSKLNWECIKKIVQLLHERQGAVILVGNPIASIESEFEMIAMYRQNPDWFLRLIWIPYEWLNAGKWKACLGGSKNLENSVKLAHEEFYKVGYANQ